MTLSMWDLPKSGIKLMTPTLLTTEPPEKSQVQFFHINFTTKKKKFSVDISIFLTNYSIYFCGHYFTKSNFASLYFYHKVLIPLTMEFTDGSDYKESASNSGDPGLIPGLGRFLEKEMATHSSILPWRILWTKELVQSVGLQRVRWDCKQPDTHE